ncbi:tail assembly chaperone [Gordonia phage Clown]|uniref:Tail assembly chaperone n=1 Tax=Gordonia phage Clown TaxID=2759393 RepID=A0A7L7STJ3_9CAUD|nr:tail assembly chaperone [Gordonia phage Clown]QOC56029.1 tail assembly chaperone [Gordonia phage Clown]
MSDDTTTDIAIDDDFNIEDPDTRAELGLAPLDEEIPETLQFSSKVDSGRKVERRSITIDGQQFILTRPSDYTFYLYTPKLTSPDGGERFDTMMKFLDVVLDRAGVNYLYARMTDPANDFNPDIPPTIVATVLDLWGNKTVAELYRKLQEQKADDAPPVAPTPIGANRAQRRQATKKPAKKAAPRKAAARK